LAISRGRRAARSAPSLDPTRYTPQFTWRGGEVCCEGVPLSRIAEAAGTPAYVYSAASIRDAWRRLDRAFARLPHTICYSVKANSNRAVLQLLARIGSSFDIVSGGELYRLQRAGVSPQRVVFSGVGKAREEIRAALRAGILLFNVESEAELEMLSEEAARLRTVAPAGLRVNPDVAAGGHPHIATGARGHKFGVDWDEAARLYLRFRGSRWIEWRGISAHIGSQILRLAPFRQAAGRVAAFVRRLHGWGIPIEYFDFGGGIGIQYTRENPLSLAAYARALAAIVRPLGCRLLLEPGRVIVGPAGVLLTRVVLSKQNRGKRFVVVDAAMNDFMRPALYGAVHPITPIAARPVGGQRADIVGPVCESGDCFVQDWPLGRVAPGDLLAIWGTGAYGAVGASNYNSRPRPPEVLVEGSRFRLVRRREAVTGLPRGE
jgi:diaminopimelate decarboxylase